MTLNQSTENAHDQKSHHHTPKSKKSRTLQKDINKTDKKKAGGARKRKNKPLLLTNIPEKGSNTEERRGEKSEGKGKRRGGYWYMGFKGASGKFGHVGIAVTTWVSPSFLSLHSSQVFYY